MKNCTCQSCGMPLHKPDMYGTDRHGIRVEEYCVYCYKDGAFTEEVTMDEMIRLCARFIEGNSHDLAIANMKLQFPRLGRWARKENTQHSYYKSINRVLEYIHGHLHENTDLKTLAGIAHISPFHFHRIFKATIGESLAEYVLRLRMEWVAEQLKSSGQSLAELAAHSGYSSEQALSRAFKKYFSLPPRAFKQYFFEEKFRKELVPRICRVSGKTVIVTRDVADETSWRRLYMYAIVNRVMSEAGDTFEVFRDGEFYPALGVRGELRSDGYVDGVVLADGLYAIFTHRGDVRKIRELCEAVLHYWIPAGKYRLGDGYPYVVFLNLSAAAEDRLAEVYFPIREK